MNLIRLDAFGYTTKRAGTNCFFVEPEVWELLDRIKGTLAQQKTELLAEVHEHFTMQKRLAEHGLWVYDFALPMLTLQARLSSLCAMAHARAPVLFVLPPVLTAVVRQHLRCRCPVRAARAAQWCRSPALIMCRCCISGMCAGAV